MQEKHFIFLSLTVTIKRQNLQTVARGEKKRASPTYYTVYHLKMFQRHPEIVNLV